MSCDGSDFLRIRLTQSQSFRFAVFSIFYFNKLYSDSVKWKMVAIANYRRHRFFIVGISLETAKIYDLVFKIWLRFYFSLKFLISIPYNIGKSVHINNKLVFQKCGVWRRNVVSEKILKRHCTVCRKWFWEMRRIWGLLNEFIKITLPFVPKRWTWETDSICIRSRNWWSGLCFSQEEIPEPSKPFVVKRA